MDDVEIELAAHLRYIRPCTRTDRIATRVTKSLLLIDYCGVLCFTTNASKNYITNCTQYYTHASMHE